MSSLSIQPISLKIKMVYLIAKDKESDGQASRAIDFRLEAFRMKISFRHHSLPPPTTTPTLGSQGSSRVDTNKVGASIPSQYQVSSIPPTYSGGGYLSLSIL